MNAPDEILGALCVFIAALLIGVVFFVAILFIVIRAIRGAMTGPTGAGFVNPLVGSSPVPRGSLLASGTPARGILLAVASTGSRANYFGMRCEIRRARVDIEAQGVRPFELDTNLYIPTTLVRDALPGSTVELRINPRDQSMVLVVGPDVGYAPGAVRTS